jgi:hypothetical protein
MVHKKRLIGLLGAVFLPPVVQFVQLVVYEWISGLFEFKPMYFPSDALGIIRIGSPFLSALPGFLLLHREFRRWSLFIAFVYFPLVWWTLTLLMIGLAGSITGVYP